MNSVSRDLIFSNPHNWLNQWKATKLPQLRNMAYVVADMMLVKRYLESVHKEMLLLSEYITETCVFVYHNCLQQLFTVEMCEVIKPCSRCSHALESSKVMIIVQVWNRLKFWQIGVLNLCIFASSPCGCEVPKKVHFTDVVHLKILSLPGTYRLNWVW